MTDGLLGPDPQAASAGLVLLSDRPVAEGGQRDLLDRADEARALAGLVRASRTAAPFTLAVFADWGMGKSSLLSQMAEELKAPGDVEVVWFNAWTTRGGQGLEALVKAVLDRLDRRSLRRLARAVSGGSNAASWLRVLTRGLAGTFALHHLVDGIWEQLAIDARTRNDAQKLLRSTLEGWMGGAGEAAGPSRHSGPRRTIVVFVDDLDRCPPETIATVSSAIKQYLNVPGLVFVLACDQAVIEAAAQGSEAPAATGRRFLEKVIQASYSVPPPTDTQVADLVAGYAQEAGAAGLFRGPVGEAVVQHVGRNPRRIKRLINRFVIEYHLDAEWRQLGADALVRVALLQDFYPEFHRLLSLAGELDPIEAFGDYLAVLRAHKQGLPEADGERARVARTLADCGVRDTGDVTAHAVGEVERTLPEQFPALARDRTFVRLVEYLVNLPAGEQLRLKLRRSSDLHALRSAQGDHGLLTPPGFTTSLVSPPNAVPAADLTGLRVLRLNSRPEAEFVDLPDLHERGAIVTWSSTVEDAVDRIRREPPDVVMTNLHREWSDDGGFEDIEALHAHGYTGPVIVYSGYVTPARRERAERVGAKITEWPNEVFSWLAAAVVSKRATPRTVGDATRDMEGLRLLWLTPEADLALHRSFESRGALITTAGSPEAAASAARREPPDVLVAEGAGSAAEGIEFVRRTAFYNGPVVIFTSRVTPDRRNLARDLEAEITDDSEDLAETLVRTAADLTRRRTPPPRPADDAGGDSAAARADYDRLARSAQRLQEIGEIDKAEQQWSSAEYLAHTNADTAGTLRAMVMRAGIALSRRRYALAIGRYNYALVHGAVEHLDSALVTRIFHDLGTAYTAIGDEVRAGEARDSLAEYLAESGDAR